MQLCLCKGRNEWKHSFTSSNTAGSPRHIKSSLKRKKQNVMVLSVVPLKLKTDYHCQVYIYVCLNIYASIHGLKKHKTSNMRHWIWYKYMASSVFCVAIKCFKNERESEKEAIKAKLMRVIGSKHQKQVSMAHEDHKAVPIEKYQYQKHVMYGRKPSCYICGCIQNIVVASISNRWPSLLTV